MAAGAHVATTHHVKEKLSDSVQKNKILRGALRLRDVADRSFLSVTFLVVV